MHIVELLRLCKILKIFALRRRVNAMPMVVLGKSNTVANLFIKPMLSCHGLGKATRSQRTGTHPQHEGARNAKDFPKSVGTLKDCDFSIPRQLNAISGFVVGITGKRRGSRSVSFRQQEDLLADTLPVGVGANACACLDVFLHSILFHAANFSTKP